MPAPGPAVVTSAGLVLAAGAGRRMGRPKGLLRGPGGDPAASPGGVPWVERAVEALRGGGCDPVLVVVGAAADDVALLVPAGVEVVRAPDWQEGMGASLRAGLAALAGLGGVTSAVVALVDMPGVGPAVVRRLLAATDGPGRRAALARASYDGVPGHPVLLGSRHWDGVRAAARGDAGARDYLRGRDVLLVECGDVGSGEDVDVPIVGA